MMILIGFDIQIMAAMVLILAFEKSGLSKSILKILWAVLRILHLVSLMFDGWKQTTWQMYFCWKTIILSFGLFVHVKSRLLWLKFS